MMPTMILLFWVLVLAAVGAWMWGNPRELRLPPKTQAELDRLRDEVDRLSDQVSRLAEEQSYMTRLLADGEQRTPLPKPEIRDADA